MTRSLVRNYFFCALGIWIAGCSNVDWNWDTSWWKKPKRIVKPQPAPTGSNVDQSANLPNAATQPSETGTIHAENPPEAPATTPEPEKIVAAAPSPAAPVPSSRAFYQLYFVSGATQSSESRGEFQVHVKDGSARAAGTLIEWLYPPIGRSGSRDDCYLLYENSNEFQAASQFSKLLSDGSTGLASELSSPVTMSYQLIDGGPVADHDVIDKCVKAWSDVPSDKLPENQKWAAAIITGKLLADYQYDYAKARNFFTQAAQFVPDGSLEKKTALWWTAEAFSHEGNRPAAIAEYEKILSIYGEKEENTQIVKRAEAAIDKLKKR